MRRGHDSGKLYFLGTCDKSIQILSTFGHVWCFSMFFLASYSNGSWLDCFVCVNLLAAECCVDDLPSLRR